MKTISERVCRVLEGLTGLEWMPKNSIGLEYELIDLVYIFCHISGAGGESKHKHPLWMKLFEEVEAEVESSYYSTEPKYKPRCPICHRYFDEACGTVYCSSHHGICGSCGTPRPDCECQTSETQG